MTARAPHAQSSSLPASAPRATLLFHVLRKPLECILVAKLILNAAHEKF